MPDEAEVPSTALTVAQRAAVALGEAECVKRLTELAKQSVDIVAVTNPASYQQLHSARMALKNERIELQKTGKTAREDAAKYAKAIIQVEDRLIGIIEPEEKRLQAIQDAYDKVVAERKAAAEKAEAERIERIQGAIRDIRGSLIDVAGKPSGDIEAKIRELAGLEIYPNAYDEFLEEAESERTRTLARLRDLHTSTLTQEQEAVRLAAERAEFERQKAEHEEAERQARERAAADQKRRDTEEAERREAMEKQQAAYSEITGIQQQVIIADIGRLGVRVGGTIACIEETLAETEAWTITEEKFGVLMNVAQDMKDRAVATIRSKLDHARHQEAEHARIKSEVKALEDRQRAERDAEEERQRKARLTAEQEEREREAAERKERDRIEAESRAKADQERKDHEAAEQQDRERRRQENAVFDGREMLMQFKARFGMNKEFAKVTKAINAYFKATPAGSTPDRGRTAPADGAPTHQEKSSV